MKSYWREKARPIVAAVLRETRGQEEPVIRRALTDAYPFGERRMWPYKAWLAEIAAQRGRKKKTSSGSVEVTEDQFTLEV